MKLLKNVYFFSLFLGVSLIKAQNINNQTLHLLTVDERTAAENNPNNEVLANRRAKNADVETPSGVPGSNYVVDERAYKYYYQYEINEMSTQKRKRLNYLLNNSFDIVKTQNVSCPPLDKNTVNTLDYYYQRKVSERTEITTDEKCGYKIILHSISEVEKAQNLITE